MKFLGASGGGSKYKTTADNLFTTDVVEALLGISEGPIKGLKDGAKTFYLGDTPLVGQDGKSNFESFQLKTYLGNELGENINSLIGGFGTPTQVGVSLTQGLAVTRSGTHTDIDYLDVRLVIGALVRTDDKGEYTHSGQVRLEYKRATSSTWLPVNSMTNLSNYELPILEANYDTHVRIGEAFPTDSFSGTFLRRSENYRAYIKQGTSWVQAPIPQYSVGVGERQPISPGESRFNGILIHLIEKFFWVNPVTEQVRVYNGYSWVAPGSSGKASANATTSSSLENGVIQISGKTTSGVVQEFRIPVASLDNDTYDVRVTVISGQDTSGNNKHRFDVTWESLQEITAKAYNFPGLAVTQVAGRSSDQLSSLPELSGIYQGRIVRVPSNYDPETRTYTGVWNGAWKMAYTNNAAFIGNDLVLNTRYGMNAYYPVELNKWDVYEAGQWCDVPTADGTPRFTFNGLLTDPLNGREAIQYIFGIMGARFFDDGNGQAVLRIDKPQNPVAVFGPENVVEGTFTYSFTGISTQYNDITVNFINPDLNWQQDKRRVYDQDHINRYGRVPKSITAVGCTSVSEAIRRARYHLVTSLTEKTSVSFKTNRQALFLVPYDTILVADPEVEFGWSGRVTTFNTVNNSFQFRDPIFLESGPTYQVHFMVPTPDKGFETFTMNIRPQDTGASRTSLRVIGTLPSQITEDMQFSIGTVGTNVAPKPFRVMSITPDSDDEDMVTVEAIEVNRVKWDYIDGHVDTIPVDVTGSDAMAAPLPVASLSVVMDLVEGRRVLTLRWGASPSTTVASYQVRYSRNGDAMMDLGATPGLQYVIPNLLTGDYLFSVTPISRAGIEGPSRYARYEVQDGDDTSLPLLTGLTAEAVTGLAADGTFFAYLQASWTPITQPAGVTYDIGYRKVGDSIFRRSQSTQAGFRSPHIEGNSDYVIEVSARVGNIPLTARTSVTVHVSGDDTVPPAPSGWSGTPGFRQVTLNGNASSEPDFKEFVIYASATQGGSYAQIATVVSPQFVRLNPTTHWYRVAQRDRSGNLSPRTSAFEVRPIATIPELDDTPPAVPTGLAVSSELGKLIATWNPNPEGADKVYYELEITEAGGNPQIASTSGLRYELIGVKPNVAFSLRLRAVNAMGWKSNWTAPVTHTTMRDTTPPAVPTGVTVQAGFGTLWVKWIANVESDFAFYEVYESATTTAPTAGTTATYRTAGSTQIVTGLAEAATRHYWVRAVDTSGNKSAWSAIASGTTASIWQTQTDPLVPTGLVVSRAVGVINARWNTSANSISYELGVTEGTGNEIVLPAGDIRLSFPSVAGVDYALRVRGVNRVGVRSDWSPVLNTTGLRDTTPPARPAQPVVKPGFKTLWVEWARNTEADLAYYEIAAHTAAFSTEDAPTYIVAQTPATSIALTGLGDSAQRFFRIRAVDTSGNTSLWNHPVVSGTTLAEIDPTITTEKLAGLVDGTSLKNGVELLTVWTGAALPTTRQTATLSWNGKLYQWDGTKYVPLADTLDLTFENISGNVTIPDGSVTADKIAQDLQDMIEAQGQSASADAAAAEQARAAAEASANAAGQSATNAAGSANAAAGSASTAASRADAAGLSATAAEASVVKAQLTAARLFPADFRDGATHWTRSTSGAPETALPVTTSAAILSPEGVLTILGSSSGNSIMQSRQTLAARPGRRYRITVEAMAVGGIPAVNRLQAMVLHLDGSFTNLSSLFGNLAFTATDEWQLLSAVITTADPLPVGTVMHRLGARILGSAQPAFDIRIRSITTEDITESVIAGGHAAAAAESSRVAGVSATEAGVSATAAATARTAAETAQGAAATSASNAASSETNAAGSASTAQNQAGAAAQSATQAGQSAGAAATSAQTAGTKATEAEQSAIAANTSKTQAETARGAAEAAATSAAQSVTDAQGWAGQAATASNVSVQAVSTAQRLLNTARVMLPSIPDPAAQAFSNNNAGNVAPDSLYDTDADGPHIRASAATAGSPLGMVGFVPLTAAGRVYRIRMRFWTSVAAPMRLNCDYRRADGTSAQLALLQIRPDNHFAANTVHTHTITVGPQAGGLVDLVVPHANWLAQPQIRLALDTGMAGTSPFRLYEFLIEDVTEADIATRQAGLATGSAAAAATSASNAQGSETAAGQSASAANTARTEAETARGQASTFAGQASQSATDAAGSATTASQQAGLATTARGQAEGFANAASQSATTAETKAGEAGTSATVASGHANTAETQAGIAVTKAGEAASSATSAAGSVTEASSYARLAALALSGGMAKNPTFANWTGATPPNVSLANTGQGPATKAAGKYGNAVDLESTVTTGNGPVVQMVMANGHLLGNGNARQVLVTVEIEPLAGVTSGTTISVGWRNVTTGNFGWSNAVIGPKLQMGALQTVQVALDRPAGIAQSDAINVQVHASHSAGTRALCKVRIHRLDVQEIVADSFVDEQRRTKATVDGWSQSAYMLRVKAGGASAGFEMIAANDPTGPASSIRMSADEILLDGTVKTPHLDAGVVTAAKLAVGFGGNLLSNTSYAAGLRNWQMNPSGTTGTQTVLSLRAAGTTWAGRVYPVLQMVQTGTSTDGWTDLINQPVSLADGSLGYGFPVKPGDWIEHSVQVSTHRCEGQLRIQWLRADGSTIGYQYSSVTGSVANQPGDQNNPDLWPRLWARGQAPAEAAFARFHLRKLATLSGTDSYLMLHKAMQAVSGENRSEPVPYAPDAVTYIDGEGIITDTIKGRAVDVLSLTAKIATVETAFIKDAHIVELSAATLKAGTALASTITVQGTALSTINDRAANPAARINASSTLIDPGKIQVNGTTTLADWRYGPDQTRIDGGRLGANSVVTNALQVGLRNITLNGLVFEHNSPGTNRVSWTAGSISWIDDAGTLVTTAIAAGNSTASTALRYIYWTKGAGVLSVTTDVAVAKGADAVPLATYEGGIKLCSWIGRTIIDGGNIKAETITAAQLIKTAAVITESAQIKSAIIDDAHIKELSAAKLKAGTALAGSVLVNGRALGSMAATSLIDILDQDWTQTAGSGTFTYAATGQNALGTRYIRTNGDGQVNLRSPDIFPYDPTKLHRVSFRVRRISGTTGAMYLGLFGLKADRATYVDATGSDGANAHWYVASNIAQSGISTGYTEYVAYLKGTFPVGGTTSGAGTIASPRTVQIAANYLQPGLVFNNGGGNCQMALDSVKIEVVDEAAGEIINAGETLIEPGKIKVAGSTTLADWRKGGDETKIDGGKISANTVETNALTVGNRNITLTGVTFEHNRPAQNQVWWSTGTIRWINDAGAPVGNTITTGSATWTSGVLYLYWTKGDNNIPLRTTTSLAVAMGADNVVLATYEGNAKLDADYGRTIIDGGLIKTETIDASRLVKTTALITEQAQMGSAVVGTLAVAGEAITATRAAEWDFTPPRYSESTTTLLSWNVVLPHSTTYIFMGDVQKTGSYPESASMDIEVFFRGQSIYQRSALGMGTVANVGTFQVAKYFAAGAGTMTVQFRGTWAVSSISGQRGITRASAAIFGAAR